MDIIRKRIARRSSGQNLGRASNTAATRSPPSIRVDQPRRRRSRRSAKLCDRWARERSYSEPYQFPTRRRGDFAHAMSAIARNSRGADQRTGHYNQDFESKFHEQVSQALALKLNLSTHQHANEKALGVLRKSGGEGCNLKQTLQARAAIYDSEVSPTWFGKDEALNSKAKTLKLRRAARSHLIAAPLFIAQVGVDKVQQIMNRGKHDELEVLKLSDKGTVAEVIDILARAPPSSVWKLLNTKTGLAIEKGLRKVADDLDFAQTLVSLVSQTGQLNSVKNALVRAFRRRNTEGVFQLGQSMSLDTLLNSNADDEGDKDQDDNAQDSPAPQKKRLAPRGSTTATTKRLYYCYD